ncbi:MAG: tetratricopeptide repeat protein [Gemmatimonadetes bacterium]|nr:tetratricopeptide repeat protein [Gemmatimonadota bacterium]
MYRRIGAFVLAVALGACATKRDLLDLQTEIRESDVRQQARIDALTNAMQQGNRQALDSVAAASELVFDVRGDLVNAIRDIERDLMLTREVVGTNQSSLVIVLERLEELSRDVQALTRAVNRLQQDSVDVGVEGADPAPVVTAPSDPADDFAAIVRAFENGSFTVARMQFERFVTEFPDNELAPTAHLYLGELFAVEQRFQEAIDTYLQIPQLDPDADEAPQALYRAALLYLDELDDTDRARALLETVVESYSDHSVAELARAKLAEIP